MKYIFKNINRLSKKLHRHQTPTNLHHRFLHSTTLQIFQNQKPGNIALFSLSNNIFDNLALENFIANSLNTQQDRNVLLIWISEPCIVFGRHQNPWLECDVKKSFESGVQLVRRYSGGGCVYHDLGNLNISFLTNRLKFDRKTNLEIIKNSLEKSELFHKNYQFEISPRHDIFVRDTSKTETAAFKITGSAARLAQKFAYHHCTLLYNVQMANMGLLKSNLAKLIRTKATPSVPAKCVNMKDYLLTNKEVMNNEVIMNKLVESLCKEYWTRMKGNWALEFLFDYIDPREIEMGVIGEKSLRELHSWEHKFGTTPKFSIDVKLDDEVSVTLVVESGCIVDFSVDIIAGQIETSSLIEFKNLLKLLLQCKLDAFDLSNLLNTELLSTRKNVYFLKFAEFLNKNF